MRILFVGVSSWLHIQDVLVLQKLNNEVIFFDYRKKKKISNLNLFQKSQLENREEFNLRSFLYNNLYKKFFTKINNIGLPVFKKIKHFTRYYLFGVWKLNKQLLNEVKNTNYDLVFLSKAERINYKLIPKLNVYTKTWFFFMDPLITAYKFDADKHASLSTWSSATFSNVNTFFKRAGARSYFITEGLYADVFKPNKEEIKKKIDVIFIGGKSAKREKYINFLKINKINVICYGKGWENPEIFVSDFVKKHWISKIILNFTRGNIGFSNRVFMAMATGSFLISEFCLDLKKIFRKGVHLEWFSTPEDLLGLIKYYLENETIRENIAYQGCKFVHENFTLEKIMQKIIHIVEKNEDIQQQYT